MKQEIRINRKKMLLNAAFFICAALLFTVLAMFCFYRLGDKPIYDYDEARHGASAYEMMQSGEWIVTTYQGTPDYWNLKPPLRNGSSVHSSLFLVTQKPLFVPMPPSLSFFVWSCFLCGHGKRSGNAGLFSPCLQCLRSPHSGCTTVQGQEMPMLCFYCYVRSAPSALQKRLTGVQTI